MSNVLVLSLRNTDRGLDKSAGEEKIVLSVRIKKAKEPGAAARIGNLEEQTHS